MKKVLISLGMLIFLSSMAFAEGKLAFVTMVTRHGDRAPFANIDNAKYKWGTPLSELTPVGMNQEYNLGKSLNKRYIEDMKLLKKDYVGQSIFTLSSHTNRTVVSAQSLLIGLYPPGTGPLMENKKEALPKRFQPIPIMTLTEASKLIMFPYLDYLKVLKENVYNTKVWQDKEKELAPEFKNWTKILGNKITGLNDVLSVGDVLIVAKAHEKPLPKGLSQQEADKIIELTSWGLTQQFKSQKVSYIMGAQLVNKIIKNLKDAATGKTGFKMIYYSGHDLTLLQIMGTLGVSLEKAPGYAANIQFELYKDDAQYSVKIRYNGDFIKLPIMKDDDSCTLDSLVNYMNSINKKFGKKTS